MAAGRASGKHAYGVPLPLFDPLLTIIIAVFYICPGVYLQFKESVRVESRPMDMGEMPSEEDHKNSLVEGILKS